MGGSLAPRQLACGRHEQLTTILIFFFPRVDFTLIQMHLLDLQGAWFRLKRMPSIPHAPHSGSSCSAFMKVHD